MNKMSCTTLALALTLSWVAPGAGWAQSATAPEAAQPNRQTSPLPAGDHRADVHHVVAHRVPQQPVARLDDAQIAHIAYTAGAIDVSAAQQALAKSQNKEVRGFAELMVRDHTAVNNQATMLLKRLNVTPQDNATSRWLLRTAKAEQQKLNGLTGEAFDKAYVDNEVAYHKKVLAALNTTLIPESRNADLKSLLTAGSSLFESHEKHAEMLDATLK